ncbi:MAG: hypothetical protein ACRC7H_01360, partial [Plesiomonas shigelloides]
MKIDFSSQTLNISHNGDILFSHQPGLPAFFLGKGMEKMEIYRGNFDIEDYVESRVALTHVRSAGDHVFTFAPCANTAALLQMTVVISADDEDVSLQFSLLEGDYNRFWMRLPAEKQEHIWGCGEQMSYFDLRGRHFP